MYDECRDTKRNNEPGFMAVERQQTEMKCIINMTKRSSKNTLKAEETLRNFTCADSGELERCEAINLTS